MPQDVRFIMVGGFLGAGKTTALIEIARRLAADGKRVGIITNDQADDLVDTGLVQTQGMEVEEIPGGCFCCRFNDLVGAADKILSQKPDVLLGEPVGSCTDISATVFQPLKDLYGGWFRMAPFSVLVDPDRARKLLLGEGESNVHEDVAYLFEKQLEEADMILLNKVDLLSANEVEALAGELGQRFPETPVHAVSFKEGTGLDAWIEETQKDKPAGQRLLEIDYERYAHAEAVLGWLNTTVVLQSEALFDAGDIAQTLIGELRSDLTAKDAEIAHVKLLVSTAAGTLVANVVSLDSELTVRGDDLEPLEQAVLTLNARVHLSPEELEQIVRECVDRVAANQGLTAGIRNLQCFSPAPPTPTHRYTEVVAQTAQ